MSEENIEEVKEEAISSETNVEQSTIVQEEIPNQEPVESPKPGSIEYTKAVEETIGKKTAKIYKAEAERDLYKQRLEQLELQKSQPQATPEAPVSNFAEAEPTEASYDDYNQYIKDLASWQFRKEQTTYQANMSQQTAQETSARMERDFNSKVKESKVLEEHPDFYDKMRFVNLVPGLHETVLTSDKGPELALHLAENPELMRDLNSLSPLVAARKLGAIEAKLSGKIEKKTVSSAPNPVTPVNSTTGAVTEDSPKDINDWMKKRQEQRLAKIKNNVEGGRVG